MADKIDDVFVDIYALVKLTEGDKKRLSAALMEPDDDDGADLSWIKPRFVDWAGPDGTDGTDDDMLARFKAIKQQAAAGGGAAFTFFVDRRSLEELGGGGDGDGHPSVVLAADDAYTLLYADDSVAELGRLLRAHGTGAVPEWDEGLRESLADELCARAMVRGRIPARGFRSAWANLDIANMDMVEIVEMHGGEVEVVPDPEWDAAAVVRKAEELYKAQEGGEQEQSIKRG